MLIANIGDSHFHENSRFEECVNIHAWITEDIAKRGVDLVLHAGDIYEGASTPQERKAVAEWLQAMAEICPVVIVKGNHDASLDCEILGRLKARHPIIVEERAGVHHIAGAAIACLAWPRKAQIMTICGPENADTTAHMLLQNVIRGLGGEMDAFEGPRILLGHAMVRGSKVSTGQELVGCDFELGLEDLALARADLVVLGHIHMAQAWTYGDTSIVYTGSPRRKTFGETEEKSYAVAWFPDEGGKPCEKWHRVPTPATPMVLYTGEWGEFNGAMTWAAENIDRPDHHKGAEVRFRYAVDADQRDAAKAAAAKLKEKLLAEGAISCKLEEVVRPTTKARAPEVAAAKGIEDKLVAYWRSKGTEPGRDRKERLLDKVRILEAEATTEAA